uniref:Uncharacterized protein n=1 Tax=Rhizophora mucronata TaxID=61149 RepID=A0A2P2IN71_RHIMU
MRHNARVNLENLWVIFLNKYMPLKNQSSTNIPF